MRKGKEKKGVESAAVCSAQFLNQSLTGFSRCFLSGEHRRGEGRRERILQSRDSTEWSWRVASGNGKAFFRFLLLTLFSLAPFALPILPPPQRHQIFSIALRSYYRRFPSFPILSFLLLTLHPQRLFPVKRRYRCDARELDTDLRFIFFISLDAFDRLKYNSSTQRERDNSIVKRVDRVWEDRFEKEFIHVGTHFSWCVFFKVSKCFWKKHICTGHFCRKYGRISFETCPYEEAFTSCRKGTFKLVLIKRMVT